MIDIQILRDNPKQVAEKSAQKGYPIDADKILSLDSKRKELLSEIEVLRAQRNEIAGRMKGGRPSDQDIAEGKRVKEDLALIEDALKPIDQELTELLKKVPNMPFDDVPVGSSEEENVVVKTWGDKPHFDFEPKSHWAIAEARGLIDKDRAAKIAGSRFAYIKGPLVQLQFAIMQWVVDTLGNESVLQQLITENNLNVSAKPFTPILPPAMIRTDAYDAMDRLEPSDDRYKVGADEDDLWLQGSAEHTLGSMYWNETLPETQLPIRYVGYLTSFRREAGTYGKDTEGILRMHQFDKLEMEVFSTAETGLDEHKLLVAIQEYLVQQLGLPYELLQKCTFDIGKPNARGIDINIWMPGQNKYRETHTADYMTDYQSRRLQTRVKRASGVTELMHTNDATAFALGRIMIAIIENFQTADGHIIIPLVLQKYLGGKEVL
ncbi:serine--tRNA ligase [bacterium]|nr:serine--tRNA ligase [bacterium]NBX97860.1 serine--tRNA ligase [bacterium]NDC94287.1 serine--tRNA ligase [bacterium]NDD84907.1 serine--tRNA ligase [bacterium]NDG28704.1 serine--tRNA ligase [bacterium]